MKEKKINIIVEEGAGISRKNEPVTVGIPCPIGFASDKETMALKDDSGKGTAVQSEVLSRWTDGSIKWILLDFFGNCKKKSTVEYTLTVAENKNETPKTPSILCTDGEETLTVNTGKAVFCLRKKVFNPFVSVSFTDKEGEVLKSSFTQMIDEKNKTFTPKIFKIVQETKGPLRTTYKFEGAIESEGTQPICNFFSRLSFFQGSGVVKVDFTIKNEKAARHPGNLWDLGDEGSILFKDLFLQFCMVDSHSEVFWKGDLKQPLKQERARKLEIYQESSGGPNWDSPNHVNRFDQVPHKIKGYEITSKKELLEKGNRATPSVFLRSNESCFSASIKNFWQNFPKAIEVNENQVKLSLFPHQYPDLFELQGGEQKTHSCYLNFESAGVGEQDFDWIQRPLVVKCSPEWYEYSKVFDGVLPNKNNEDQKLQAIVNAAIDGGNTFFDRKEIVDEFGWRNFGDLYGDHEVRPSKGEKKLISHYNNQYDVVFGTLKQFLKTGDERWWMLSSDLARHVSDIDIYHTDRDRYQYSHGMFWHTDHFHNAGTATHRTYSKKQTGDRPPSQCGGGPGMAHNYTTGLLYQYYLTGDLIYKDTISELALWVTAVLSGPQNILEKIKSVLRKVKRAVTVHQGYNYVYVFDGPGRDSGNVISAVMDFFELTGNHDYIELAEKLLKVCVNPDDDIEKRDLLNAEFRWMYTIFFQALGKYLKVKTELKELDQNYDYAKNALIAYSQWMEKNEYPFLSKPELLEHPNYGTRAAQDLRKAKVFLLAAKYVDDELLKSKFLEKAKFFQEESVKYLYAHEERFLTRPIAILMQNI